MAENNNNDKPIPNPVDVEYSEFINKYIWLVRPCNEYKDELKECRSLKGRFHQYYIYGALADCTAWQKDVNNCDLCLTKKNNFSCEEIIKNERERRMKRLLAHKNNDVWEKREAPPENWNAPLPTYFMERTKESILNDVAYNDYMEHIEKFDPKLTGSSLCTIL